jgi:hypothetical protein
MAFDLPIFIEPIGIDRQLLGTAINETGLDIIIALNPVARRAILEYHRGGLKSSIEFVANLVLKDKVYPNDIKGKISEIYITNMLDALRFFSFEYRKISSKIKSSKQIDIAAVVYFKRNNLPPKKSFRTGTTTLFVPDSPNYPAFDFFIWDSGRETLMGFQITLISPFTRHPRMTNNQNWLNFCFGESKQTPMELFWVVPERCIGANPSSVAGDYIILFEDLLKDFPALRNIV